MSNSTLQLPFLLILLSGISIVTFLILKPFFAPLALAIVFAVILYPIHKKITHHLGKRDGLSALITLIFGTLCILLPLIFLSTQIFHEAVSLYVSTLSKGNSENLLITIIQRVGKISTSYLPQSESFFVNLTSNIDTYIKQGLAWLVQHVGFALSSISGLLLNFFIFFISLYYLLRDGQTLKKAVIALSPLDDKEDELVFNRLQSAINSVVKGSLFIALVQGTLTAIGFTIFGIPNSILWGTVTIIAALIPGIGTSLIIIPGVIYLFITGNDIPALGLILWGVLAVGLIDNLLGPKLIGKNLEIHHLFILLSVLGGIAFFGPLGVFFGPLTMSLFFAFISVYSDIVNKNN